MNTENIIMIGVTLAIVAAVAYYFYTKLQSQQALIEHLTRKCDDLELMFNPRANPQELASVYSRRHPSQQQPQRQETLGEPGSMNGSWSGQGETKADIHSDPSDQQQKCADSLCDLKPMRLETNDEELDDIVSSELETLIMKKESPKRRRASRPKSPSD